MAATILVLRVLLFLLIVSLNPVLAGSTGEQNSRLSLDDARHLLSRTGLGVSPELLLAYRDLSRTDAINKVIDGFSPEPFSPMPAWTKAPVPHYYAREDLDDVERALFNNDRDAELSQLRQWWVLEMLQTPSPQTERMVLFWHDIFASSYHGTDHQSLAMARQNQTFRRLGMGSWPVLLKAMIRDPALLEYLDAESSNKQSPNENLARELLELFTLGEGEYSEFTVKQAARSLTGRSNSRIHDLAFRLQGWKYDDGSKTLFGNTGSFDGDDLIDIILQQDAAARFLSMKFWHAFVADSAPDPDWVTTVASVFRSSDYNIQVLYRAVLESDAFWHRQNRGALIKSPVDLLLGTARSLEYPKQQWRQIASALEHLGMSLFSPPNVAGWKEGGAFITPGRLLDRYRFVNALLTDSEKVVLPAGMTSTAMMTGSGASALTMANSMSSTAMMSELGRNTRLSLRLAAEDFQGPVRFQVIVTANGAVLWRSEETVFPDGRDTESLGRIGNRSELVWSTVPLPAPDSVIEKATHIEVIYLNDAAGAAGDRNLYVDGIRLDRHWLSSGRAVQNSECVPAQAQNAGNLYCAGSVRFTLPDSGLPGYSDEASWRASAAHVSWASENEDERRQTVYLTLDHLQTPDHYFHTLQFGLVIREGKPASLRLESYGCWPDCVSQWPDCAWVDRHEERSKTLVFPRRELADKFWASDHGVACHYRSLTEGEKDMVGVLWSSAESLLKHVQSTQRASRFSSIIADVEQALAQNQIPLENTPYAGTTDVITLDVKYKPGKNVSEDLNLLPPLVENAEQLLLELQKAEIPLRYLLVPQLEGLALSGLDLRALTEHPVFQLK